MNKIVTIVYLFVIMNIHCQDFFMEKELFFQYQRNYLRINDNSMELIINEYIDDEWKDFIFQGKYNLYKEKELYNLKIDQDIFPIFFVNSGSGGALVLFWNEKYYFFTEGMNHEGKLWRFFNISSSSILEEKNNSSVIKYYPKNLRKIKNVWATNKNGGINEYLEIDNENIFTNNIVFLNGYIDINKPELYFQNSRMKRVRITDLESKDFFNIKLEDIPNLQYFKFPFQTDNFKIEILESYPGTKYNDLCVTALFWDAPEARYGNQ